MTDKEKVQKLINEYGRTQEGFASLLGVATSTVANWRFRNKLTPTAVNLILRRCPEVNPEWLEGESNVFKLDRPVPQELHCLYDDVVVNEDELSLVEHSGSTPPMITMPDVPSTEYVRVSGCSLQPTILQGDIIGIHPFEDWTKFRKGEIYFILTKENERLLKYIYSDEDEKNLFCYSENPMSPPICLPKANIFRIYKVDFFARMLQ